MTSLESEKGEDQVRGTKYLMRRVQSVCELALVLLTRHTAASA